MSAYCKDCLMCFDSDEELIIDLASNTINCPGCGSENIEESFEIDIECLEDV